MQSDPVLAHWKKPIASQSHSSSRLLHVLALPRQNLSKLACGAVCCMLALLSRHNAALSAAISSCGCGLCLLQRWFICKHQRLMRLLRLCWWRHHRGSSSWLLHWGGRGRCLHLWLLLRLLRLLLWLLDHHRLLLLRLQWRHRWCLLWCIFILAVQCDLLLFEVAPVLLIHKHKVEEIAHTELVVHVLVRGRQVVRRQKQPA